MRFGNIQSKAMIMPNGIVRMVQYNINTGTATWNYKGRAIPGYKLEEKNGVTKFIPHHAEDTKFIKGLQAERIRLPTPYTVEEFHHNKAIVAKFYNARIQINMDRYGGMVEYEGKSFTPRYTANGGNRVRITANGQVLVGHAVNGQFIVEATA